MEHQDFRKELDRIICDEPLCEHPMKFARLSYQYTHNITLQNHPNEVDEENGSFRFILRNCVPGQLWGILEEQMTSGKSPEGALLSRAVSGGCMDLHDEMRGTDRFVVYFNGNEPKHIARIEGRNCISKWGKKGHVWRHRLWEVPFSYGTTAKFSNGLIDHEALRALMP